MTDVAATEAILPGSTIGVLGSGQLGRMLALAARAMGYRVHVFSPERDTPAGQVADCEVQADYGDLDRVAAFARAVDVVTFEFENIPALTLDEAARHSPVRPGRNVLYTAQHRLREKTYLSGDGFPVVPFRLVKSLGELTAALAELGTPAVLKSAGWGYDGKGQAKITSLAGAAEAWRLVAADDAVLEAFIDFECELSVVAARGLDGDVADWGAIGNTHANHILDVSVSPAPVPESVAREAVALAHAILESLDVVGVLCVEFFLTRGGKLVINEMAPRPHNSGHFTIDAAHTSQFEQQLRAVCGLPLGSTARPQPAAMANLLGDLWHGGEPDWLAACRYPNVKLHLYGKDSPRVGRKMGHLTCLAATAEEALQTVLAARAALSRQTVAATPFETR